MIDNSERKLLASSCMLSEVEIILILNKYEDDCELSFPYYLLEVIDSYNAVLLFKYTNRYSAEREFLPVDQRLIAEVLKPSFVSE